MRSTYLSCLACALVVASCAAPPPPLAPALLARHVNAAPDAVVTAAARVLATHGFTLAPIDRATGVVQSQPLEVTNTWEGAAVQDRVDCGSQVGSQRAASQPVSITLAFLTTPDTVGGTRVALKPTVTTYDAVAKSMAARNPLMAGQAMTTSCQLTPAFVASLLDELPR